MGWDNPPIPWDELRRRMTWNPPSEPEGAALPGLRSDEGATREGSASKRPQVSEPISRERRRSDEGRRHLEAAGSRASQINWAELHVHSSYSFLDGASSPAELVAEAKRL